MSVIKFIGSVLNGISYVSPSYASRKALNLFATPRKGRITEDQIPVLETAFKEETFYNDIPIMTYRWLGKGKTVLLAHGWESNVTRWDFLIDELKSLDYNIIGLDAPAHGNSGSKQFNAVLYSECINVVVQKFDVEIIIGHSVGGMASLFFQYNHQYIGLKRIVSLGAPAHFVGVFKRYTDMLGYNKRIINGLNALVLKRFNQSPDYFSAAKFSENITAKGLIVHDTKDKVIPYEDALLINKHYKNSELFTTTAFGHGLKSPEITKKILDFISS